MSYAACLIGGLCIGYLLACLMCACGPESDDVKDAVREAKRKGLHALN